MIHLVCRLCSYSIDVEEGRGNVDAVELRHRADHSLDKYPPNSTPLLGEVFDLTGDEKNPRLWLDEMQDVVRGMRWSRDVLLDVQARLHAAEMPYARDRVAEVTKALEEDAERLSVAIGAKS